MVYFHFGFLSNLYKVMTDKLIRSIPHSSQSPIRLILQHCKKRGINQSCESILPSLLILWASFIYESMVCPWGTRGQIPYQAKAHFVICLENDSVSILCVCVRTCACAHVHTHMEKVEIYEPNRFPSY